MSKTNVIAIGYYLKNAPAILLSQSLIPDLFIGKLLCEVNKCSGEDIKVVGMKIITIQKKEGEKE